jgi:hypothetical protein
MSEQTVTTTKPARAQSAAAKPTTEQPETKANKPFDPTDVNFFLENMRLSDTDVLGVDPYKWNKKATPQHWGIVWRHTCEIENEREALAARGIFLVEKGGAIYTQPFSGPDGLFLDECFDKDTGRIHSKYRKQNRETMQWEPEWCLYVRPIGAQVAALKKTIERVKDKTERKPEQRSAKQREAILEAARAMTNTPGAVSVEMESDEQAEVGYETL